MKRILRNTLLGASLLLASSMKAQLSITAANAPYTQDFNSIAVSGSSSTLPLGWKILETGTNANTTFFV